MKGLLHRLADRAAGTATLLRPNSRAGYAAAPMPLETDMGWPADRPAPPTTPAAQAMTSQHRPHTNVETGSMASSRDHAAAISSREAALPVQSTDADIGPAPLRPPAESTPPSVQAESSGAQLQKPSREIEVAIVGVPRQLDAEPDILVAPRAESTSIDAPALHRTEAQPTRLLPPTAATPPRNAGSSLPAQRPGATDDSTEVHIHIGRIDVTAVHEPPPRRRAPVASAAPMSLDAYLAKRRTS